MKASAKILLVDDDRIILTATERILKTAGYEVLLAQNGEQALNRVQTDRPDLILLDVNLPDMSGHDVCRQIKSDTEFEWIFIIMLSAVSTDSESQSLGLDAGADGYIARPIANRELLARIQSYLRIKTAEQKLREYTRHLEKAEADAQRLIHQLEVQQTELEMQNEELRHARTEIEATSQRYSELYNFAPSGYFTLKRDGAIQQVNLTGATMLGKERDELIDRRLGIFISSESRITFNTFLEKLFKSRRKEMCEVMFQMEGLAPQWIHIEGTCSKDGGEYNVIAVDISARKQAEEALRESEDKFKYVFEYSIVGNSFTLLSGEIKANKALCDMFGYTETEFQNKKWQEITHPEDIELTQREIDRLLSGVQSSARFAKRYIHKNGSVVWVDLSSSLRRDADGKPLYLMTSVIDITERKLVETASQMSEQRFREIFENTNDAIYIWSLGEDGRIAKGAEVNDVACKRMGYSKEEFLQLSPVDINAGNIREKLPHMIAPLLSHGQMFTEVLHRTKDGRNIPVEISSRIVELMGEKKIISLARDITERKQAEVALQKSQTQFQAIMDFSPALISIKDLNGNIIQANRGFSVLDAPPLNELIGKNVFDVFPREVAEQLWNNDLAALQTTAPIQSEEVVKHKDGTWHTYWTTKFPIYLQSEQPFGICAISNDITDRKQSEEKLIASEIRYHRLFEAARDGILILDADTGMIMDVNPFLTELLGFSHEVFLGKEIWELGFFKDIAANKANFLELQQKEFIRYEDLPLETADGRTINVEFSSYVYQVGNGKVVQCNIRDITERKRAENALALERSKLAAAFENTAIGLVLCNGQGGDITMNASALRFHEFASAEDMHSKVEENENDWDLHYPDGRPMPFDEWPLIRAIRGDFVNNFELHYRNVKSNNEWDCNLTIAPVTNSAGEVTLIVQTLLDITEHKRAEEKLLTSELRFRRLFEAAKDGILILDAENGMILDVNPFLIQLLGFSHEAFLGKEIWELGFFKDIAANQANFLELQQKEFIRYEDLPLETAHGRIVHVEFISNVYLVNHRKVIQCNVRDITERQLADEKIKSQLDELQRWQDVMLGREDRVQELKREVNELCHHAGKPARYSSQKDDLTLNDLKTNNSPHV